MRERNIIWGETMNTWELIAFIAYFIIVLAIGVIMYVKTRGGDDKDYFLGGRQMGSWVTALSASASDMSAWLLMGLPGSVLAFGLGKAWIGIGLAIGTSLNWLLVAKRLRQFSKAAGDSITMPQYLGNRFKAATPVLQIICAVIFLVCFTVYVASSFVAGATVFCTVFPTMAETTAMIIFAAIIVFYTFLGGYKAVCWTDFFQGMLMLVALLAVPIVIVATMNPDASALNTVYTNASDGTVYAFTKSLFSASWQDIVSGLAWGLGYFGMPHIIVRFMSIEKPSMVKKSAAVAIVWTVLSLGAAILIAYYGRMIVGEELLTAGMQKTVFIVLARKLFPALIAGILMAAIIAASMSTADSQLLVASSAFTSDIYKPLIRKNASNKETLWVGRLVVLAVAVVAYFIASSKGHGAQAIMNMVENAWGGFGAAFGPAIILSLFWRNFTYKGAIAGILAGAASDVIWLVFLSSSTGVYELLPAFVIGMLFAVVVSVLDSSEDKKNAQDYYDELVRCEDND